MSLTCPHKISEISKKKSSLDCQLDKERVNRKITILLLLSTFKLHQQNEKPHLQKKAPLASLYIRDLGFGLAPRKSEGFRKKVKLLSILPEKAMFGLLHFAFCHREEKEK